MSQTLPFSEAELAIMLSTRLCHDMAGPISAVSNGLEFYHDVENDAAMQEQAMELLSMSAKASQARLQMHRIAFGRADSSSESSLSEFKEIVGNYFSQGKVLIEWDEASCRTGWLDNEMRRLVASMILLASQVMVYGGRMTIFLLNNYKDVIVKGVSGKLKVDEEFLAIINGSFLSDDVELSPHNVSGWMLLLLWDLMALDLSLQIDAAGQGGEPLMELKAKYTDGK